MLIECKSWECVVHRGTDAGLLRFIKAMIKHEGSYSNILRIAGEDIPIGQASLFFKVTLPIGTEEAFMEDSKATLRELDHVYPSGKK